MHLRVFLTSAHVFKNRFYKDKFFLNTRFAKNFISDRRLATKNLFKDFTEGAKGEAVSVEKQIMISGSFLFLNFFENSNLKP